jgi:hypothetical protein
VTIAARHALRLYCASGVTLARFDRGRRVTLTRFDRARRVPLARFDHARRVTLRITRP